MGDPQKHSTEEIARAAHEVNRVFCEALGDYSQVTWDAAPEWQRASAIAGVRAVADGSATTPAGSHASWVRQKIDDGWSYGDVKDPDLKTHPCLVPYSDLPPEQRAKDSLFLAVVRGLL